MPGTGEVPFALGYAAVRLIVALYYLHVRSTHRTGTMWPASRAGFSAVGAAWLASTLLPPTLRLVVWSVETTVFDVLMPRLAAREAAPCTLT